MVNNRKFENKIEKQFALEMTEQRKRINEFDRLAIKHEATVKALLESEMRLRDFLDNCNDLIQVVDPNCRFIYVNRKWREILGYTEEEVNRLTLWDILQPDQHQHCQELFKRVCAGEILNGIETVFVTKNGQAVFVEGNVNARFEDGKFISTRGIFRDITERKRIERELERKRQELEKSNTELAKLNDLKNQFLGMAAHDLRNPLSIILACSDLLLNDAATKLTDANRHDFIKRIKENANFMLNLVNDLLDITKIESGKLELNLCPVEIIHLVQRNLEFNRMLADQKNITLILTHPESLPLVMADAARIEQVLNNLIGNAIKFSPPNRTIEVTLSVEDNFVKIAVRDEGTGIAPEELDKLFKPFSPTRKKGTAGEKTTGLGLAIAKKIVETHHGKIWVKSKLGSGSIFYFTIPVVNLSEPFSCPDSRYKSEAELGN